MVRSKVEGQGHDHGQYYGQGGSSILCRETLGLELGLGFRLGSGSGSAFVVYIEGLCKNSKVFSEVCIEGFLWCIDRLFEVFREDFQRSIVIRRSFKTI